MTSRRNMLIVLVAALAIVSFGWAALLRSGTQEQVAQTETGSAHAANKPFRNPFPSASEVRLFVETGYHENGDPIYSKPRGLVLTSRQRADVESRIAVHTILPDEEFAACFIPHHFFRYFDKAGKLVGELEVCFCCAGVQQSDGSNVHLMKDQMLVADFVELKSYVTSLGERTDVQCDGP